MNDIPLYELERTWDKTEPGSPLAVTLGETRPRTERSVRTVDDVRAAVAHYVALIPYGRVLSTAQYISTDINYHPVTGEEMSEALGACCVVTAGDQGCWYSEWGAEIRHQPAFPVDVVDTTGCGDVFHGVYAACLAAGLSVSEAVRTASAAAALKATHPGGRSGIPTLDEIRRFVSARANGAA